MTPFSQELEPPQNPGRFRMTARDVDRVARFAQGYPLMATLIATQYQKEGRLLGSIEKRSIVEKLIDGGEGITGEEREMLSACSLFDVFGTTEESAREEAKYIAEQVAGSSLKVFDRVIKVFAGRQIINRAGNYARLVPKPLALTLAAEWWVSASYDQQKLLIDTLPDSLMHSFCTQASYLDSHESVQRFSDRLFGGQSPFVKAEELITERGSKLFRAFVEVNPESTSDALYSVLSGLSREQIQDIDGQVRRNFVWGLEKLCFHADFFEKSAWCMLLLASAENESWNNNATGMFAQLFRVRLSGTQAGPKIRFELLRKAIDLHAENIDLVVLEALRQSTSTYGGTRTIGAEYQGTKAPLEEWKPEFWQDVFDFWQQAFDLMLVLLERGEPQKAKILSIIGNSIRGVVTSGRIAMFDAAIKKIIGLNGRYWPEALDSIKCAFEYDSEGMGQEVSDALTSWLELLNPAAADLPEKLKILVVNPPWEHHEDGEGRYIDVASENAKALATELSRNIEELLPHLDILLVGEQRQSYIFGYQLTLELTDVSPLLDCALEHLIAIEQPNSAFVLGVYRGIFERSPRLWQENIDRVIADDKLARYYVNFIRTGDIQEVHLDKLISLIRCGVLSPDAADGLAYGGVSTAIEPGVMIEFCSQLGKFDELAKWTALNVIYMYCFGKDGAITEIRNQLKSIVTAVGLHQDQRRTARNMHHWYDMAGKLLNAQDDEFAVALSQQLIAATKEGLDHGDIWSYAKPLMFRLMRQYGDVVWPIFGAAIVQANGSERYWLQQLLDREASFSKNMPSVLSVIPVEVVLAWCHENLEVGPVFVARCLNAIEEVDSELRPSRLFIAMLESFGDDEWVVSELRANMNSRGWSGSLVPYLESDKSVLSAFVDHENANVRRWIKGHIKYLDRQISVESKRDDERQFGLY